MKLALHLPINTVSFGQMSTLLLRTIFEREQAGNKDVQWTIFPVGPHVDLSSQSLGQDFGTWLQNKLNIAPETHDRDVPVFKLWHLNGSLESVSNRQTLLTFYELDNPTKIELNIARNSKTCFSSKYSNDVFSIFGQTTEFLPLAFDSYNFKRLDKKFHVDDRIVFNLCGKMERRKHHAKIVRAWIKHFGNNSRYVLQAAIYNPFLGGNPQECDRNNSQMLMQMFGPEGKPFNVVPYPHMKENTVYNEFLNSGDIIIGMSGGEGWGLPEFHSVAIGKHAVLLNAHSYKTWATDDMVSFVKPNGKVSAVDNLFFKAGEPFNQGNIFDWSEDDFIENCNKAIAKVEKNRFNEAGVALQKQFTKEQFLDNVIELTK
jgi:hypothetical protein